MSDDKVIMDRKKSIGTLELYSHGFKVISVDPRVATAARAAMEQWVVYDEKTVELANGKIGKERVLSQVYGGYFPGYKDFWFHKGQFKDFQLELSGRGLSLDDLVIKQIGTYTPSKIKYKLKEGRVLRDYQIEAKDFSLEPVITGDHFSKLVAMATGTGKALQDDELLVTPEGLAKIKTISVGDLVLGNDGQWVTVLGVYPQEGIRQIYQLVTEDERTVNVDGEHIWTINSDPDEETTKDVTTLELIELLKTREVLIPLYTPLQSSNASTPEIKELFNAVTWRFKGRLESLEDGWVTYEALDVADAAQVVTDIHKLGGIALAQPSKDGRLLVGIKAPFLYAMGLDLVADGEVPVFSKDIDSEAWIKVASVKENGYSTTTCIEVDNEDKLFMTSQYLAVHNTVTICGTAAENSERMVVGVLPKYSDKWGGDIVANLDLTPKQVMIIKKTTQLRGVIDLCKTQGAKKLPPVIIITLSTLRSFIDSFESDPEECNKDYGCAPWELWKLLDCGIFAVDEAHEHLNTVFKVAMYLHGPKFVAMSGTMRTEDPFQEKIQNTLFPQIKRFLKVKMKRYIDVEFIGYGFDRMIAPKIRYQAFGRPDYSHTTLEKSIMKIPRVLNGFLTMITDLLDYGYIDQRKPGEKAIIYVATVEMADKVVACMTIRYPTLSINRYCAAEGDKYVDLMRSDITVSTIQSAGTAVDVPGLTDVICTTMVSSSKSNIQVLGRLRELPDGRKVTMYMPFCRQIQKHVQYTTFRHELFKDITKSMRTFNYNRPLG